LYKKNIEKPNLIFLTTVAAFLFLTGGASFQTITEIDYDDSPRFLFEEPISTSPPKLTTAKFNLLPRLGKILKENKRTQQGVIDLKSGSTLTFTPNKLSPDSASNDYKVSIEPSGNIHSTITDHANTQAQTINSFKPTVSNLTIVQNQNASQDSDVDSRLLDSFNFPDDKLAKPPTLTTTKIIITTITNSTTTITFSNENNINLKNSYPTTLSETSSMTTTTVITTPIADIKLESRTTG
jgi:hypothetical protein